MSQENQVQNGDLQARTNGLLRGSLKHVRTAALAAALVPLASVAAGPAIAQQCPSGATCAHVPNPCDFLTSGGFVYNDNGQKVTFAVSGGCKNGDFWGHLNLVDHSSGYHLDSVEITGYLTTIDGSHTRDICGVATSNGAEAQPVYFRVRVTDNGEPGIADTFRIKTTGGYEVTERMLAGGQGGGGNVQLHDPNPSTTAPNPPPSESAMCPGLVF